MRFQDALPFIPCESINHQPVIIGRIAFQHQPGIYCDQHCLNASSECDIYWPPSVTNIAPARHLLSQPAFSVSILLSSLYSKRDIPTHAGLLARPFPFLSFCDDCSTKCDASPLAINFQVFVTLAYVLPFPCALAFYTRTGSPDKARFASSSSVDVTSG